MYVAGRVHTCVWREIFACHLQAQMDYVIVRPRREGVCPTFWAYLTLRNPPYIAGTGLQERRFLQHCHSRETTMSQGGPSQMDAYILQALQDTLSADQGVRQHAESQLSHLSTVSGEAARFAKMLSVRRRETLGKTDAWQMRL